MWFLAASSVVDDREACRARHISKMVLQIVQSGPPDKDRTGRRGRGGTPLLSTRFTYPAASKSTAHEYLSFPLLLCLTHEDILGALQPRLAASTGAACTSGIPEPSHVLNAVGLSAEEAESSIWFSFGRFTTDAEIHEAARLVSETLTSLTPWSSIL